MKEKIEAAHQIITNAIATEKPLKKVFALFSGGHDSLVATHVLSQHEAFSGVLHIDTGIGIPATQQFVVDTCEKHNWPLTIVRGSFTYEQLVVRYGFPGAAAHRYMYRYLKERPLGRFVASQKEKQRDRIGLSGGMRSQESIIRMGTVEPMHRNGATVWISAIHDWSAADISAYIKYAGLTRNRVKDNMHISGECLCGAFADELEMRELEAWYPEVAARLHKIEKLVEVAATLPCSEIVQKRCRWGWDGVMPAEQVELFDLCHYCHAERQTRTLDDTPLFEMPTEASTLATTEHN